MRGGWDMIVDFVREPQLPPANPGHTLKLPYGTWHLEENQGPLVVNIALAYHIDLINVIGPQSLHLNLGCHIHPARASKDLFLSAGHGTMTLAMDVLLLTVLIGMCVLTARVMHTRDCSVLIALTPQETSHHNHFQGHQGLIDSRQG